MTSNKTVQSVGRMAGTVLSVAAVTFLFFRVFPANRTTAALIYMMLILAVSIGWGMAESLVAALASALALSYFFLPPVGFFIAERSDWIALFAFLISAIVTSQLTARLRRQNAEVSRRPDETERLYAISRSFMLTADRADLPQLIARQLTETFGFGGAALYYAPEDRVYRSGTDVPLSAQQLREYALESPAPRHSELGVHVMPMAQQGVPMGALAVTGGTSSATARHAIANLAAITLTRRRAPDKNPAGDMIAQ